MAHEAWPTKPWFKYVVNGLGLVLLTLSSTEAMTFLPGNVIGYGIAVANVLMQLFTKGPESFVTSR